MEIRSTDLIGGEMNAREKTALYIGNLFLTAVDLEDQISILQKQTEELRKSAIEQTKDVPVQTK